MKENCEEHDRVDELDRRILQVLQADASLTNQELAARVHASAPTCLRRVRRMREAGVILATTAIVAPEKVGSPLVAIVEITLDVQTAERLEAFELRVDDEPAIQQCYRVSGGPDFVAVLAVADMAAYHALVQRVFNAAANVRNVRTFFAVRRAKFAPGIPLAPPSEAVTGTP